MTDINLVLQKYGMRSKEKELFKKMIREEKDGFLGYHGGSAQARLFQDILYYLITDLIDIPIRSDFVFLRIPTDGQLKYDNALDFIQKEAQYLPPANWDNQPHIQKHILSINISLFQSYDFPIDLTPRYFLENQTWTHPPFIGILASFFKELGIGDEFLGNLWEKGEQLLPANRGFILQIFDHSENFAFSKKCSYAAFSGGKPHRDYKDHHHLTNNDHYDFPQIRLVLGQKTTLNPNNPLSFKRYDALDAKTRKHYQTQLRNLIRQLPYNKDKLRLMKLKLLSQWKEP